MSYYVYVLRSQNDGHLYKGHTSNIEERLKYHNNGKVKSTRDRRPFELIQTH